MVDIHFLVNSAVLVLQQTELEDDGLEWTGQNRITISLEEKALNDTPES